MRKPRRKAEETREDILGKAEELFRAEGFAKVSIADIASALGMSPANIFKHFHTKTALAVAITERHISDMTERLASLDEIVPPEERLLRVAQRLMESHLDDLHRNPHIFEIVLMTADTDFPSGRLYKRLLEEKFESIIRAGVEAGFYCCTDPGRSAKAVTAALAGVLHPALLKRTECGELDGRCEMLVDLINTALQNPLAK